MMPEKLVQMAAEAAQQAHCPYSELHVGAALLADDGRVFIGCNVENASYGLTICAERAAFAGAVAAGCKDFKAMAIVVGGDGPPYPCGACRQVMTEFCNAGFEVYCANLPRLDTIETLTLGELLPKSFAL